MKIMKVLSCICLMSFVSITFFADTVKALDEMCVLRIEESDTFCVKLMKKCHYEAVINSAFCTKNNKLKQCVQGCEHKYLPSRYNRTMRAVKLSIKCENDCHARMGILTQFEAMDRINLCKSKVLKQCK